MPTVRMSFAEARARARKNKVDWERIDAMTDEDIARQIAEDPDVAPDLSESLDRGEFEVVWGIDLEHVRSRTRLDQPAFAAIRVASERACRLGDDGPGPKSHHLDVSQIDQA